MPEKKGVANGTAGEVAGEDVSRLVGFFQMTEAKAKETLKNEAMSKDLFEAMDLYSSLSSKEPSKKVSNLLYNLVGKLKPSIRKELKFLVGSIVKGDLDSEQRVTAAIKYLIDHLSDDKLNTEAFNQACGIGIVVTDEDVEQIVKDAVTKYQSEIIEKRYRFPVGTIMTHIRSVPKMQWADGGKVKNEIDQQIRILLGPKTEDDLRPAAPDQKNKKGKDTKAQAEKKAPVKADKKPEESLSTEESRMQVLRSLPFHAPGKNFTTDGYPTSAGVLASLAEHAKRINGQVRTRFPPEPNGILHIGHAKAININFGYAKAHNGICFLRYDDTNPEKEEERFFRSIKDMVEWLGYKPYKITHSSDYFNELYDFAVVLIKKGLAYVCHQTAEEVKGYDAPPSPYRDRSVATNLQLFEDMKNGIFAEGQATLRMKITLEEGKKDPVAYRIRYVPHPMSGSKWCIYPTYDFTHCLVDSLEDITHSMCTKEFQNRRSSYYWLCESVDTYVPVQWEYGRLNMAYTVVSKRKIAKLIDEKIVEDWDDPRLFTLPALRRRGFPPEAVNDFCVRMGITGATIIVEPEMIEACVRDRLNITAPRTMAVLDPIKVVLQGFTPPSETLEVPDFPSNSDSPTHKIAFRNVIYIDQDDFRDKADKDYKRFATNQPVGLRHAGIVITFQDIIRRPDGSIDCINVKAESVSTAPKPKGFIHWVSDPMEVEVRLYDRLFKHKNPEDQAQVPNGFLSDCNENTLTVKKAMVDKYLKGSKPLTQFQFERVGFFSVDFDSTPDKLVFNRTVTLKEDNKKT